MECVVDQAYLSDIWFSLLSVFQTGEQKSLRAGGTRKR